MTNPNTTGGDPVRPFRAEDGLWKPFVEATEAVEGMSAAAVLRRAIREYLDTYKIFWAPEHAAIDHTETPIAWYECDECDDVHRLNGKGAPWGCSVTKAHQDRLDKAASA